MKSEELILALETSSPVLSVAVASQRGAMKEECVKGFQSHAENLIPRLDRLLKKRKQSLRQVSRILIGRGPGSFTGLRVGFAALKALRLVHPAPVGGASSLDMIACGRDLAFGSKLVVALDARKEKIFTRIYEKKDKWQALGELEIVTVEELILLIQKNANESFLAQRLKVYLAGNTLSRYGHEIKNLNNSFKKILFLPEDSWYPKASTLIRMHFEKSPFLERLVEPRDFLPLYLRLSEAEERKKEHVACG